MTTVSIDLGSNSFRVLKYNCKTNKSISEFEKTVGTADGMSKTGDITNEALSRIITAIKESILKIDYNPTQAIAVTTQALRVAKNSTEILKTIKEQTGVDFNIIDGVKEAKLTLLSMQYALKRENQKSDDFVLLDIGGGSTELIIYQNETSTIKSFPYGIVTLSQSKNKKQDFVKFQEMAKEFIKDTNLANSMFISTAGTPTTVAALKHGLDYNTYDKFVVNGTILYLDELQNIQKELQELPKEKLIDKVGTRREDFIDTGIQIYKLFYKILDKDNSIVFDDGLREGVAIEQCLLQ